MSLPQLNMLRQLVHARQGISISMHIYLMVRLASSCLLPWCAALFKPSVGVLRNRSLARPVPKRDITKIRRRAHKLSHIRNRYHDIWYMAPDKAQPLC